ncbi:unnamed protein product [Rotaria socialis]|uniref:Uncharacterized protein n=1 Tax=Rotaria socialis TaxID=392032 RepID=A0A817VTW0_9BILA|nr:unnamed protein product [Rotaria socialis]
MDRTERIFMITKTFSSINTNAIELNTNDKTTNDIVLLQQSKCEPFHLRNIWILFLLVLPLSGILIGFLFRNDCPLQKYIPLWAIVNGFLTVIFLMLIFITRGFLQEIQHRNCTLLVIENFKVVLIFFLFLWFIRGNVS